jgi:hypothetical protein
MILSEALDISIRFWRDMAEHGYEYKSESELFYLVKGFECCCPLCEWLLDNDEILHSDCPLYNRERRLACGNDEGFANKGLFTIWFQASDTTAKKEAAQAIVDTLVAARERLHENPRT